MMTDTFANRLQKAINLNKIKPVKLAEKTGIDKSQISNYLSGNYKASPKNLELLAKELGVSEAWLLGYDNNINLDKNNNNNFNELELLFSKYKDILTKDDEETIKFIFEKRKKSIDNQEDNR